MRIYFEVVHNRVDIFCCLFFHGVLAVVFKTCTRSWPSCIFSTGRSSYNKYEVDKKKILTVYLGKSQRHCSDFDSTVFHLVTQFFYYHRYECVKITYIVKLGHFSIGEPGWARISYKAFYPLLQILDFCFLVSHLMACSIGTYRYL